MHSPASGNFFPPSSCLVDRSPANLSHNQSSHLHCPTYRLRKRRPVAARATKHFPIQFSASPRFTLPSYDESSGDIFHDPPSPSTYDGRAQPSHPCSWPVGFSHIVGKSGVIAEKPQPRSSSVEKDDSLLQFLFDEVFKHDEVGANDFMFDDAENMIDDEIDLELGELMLPASCSRSTSCLSVNSDGLAAIMEADDGFADNWMNSITRTVDWMEYPDCVDKIDEVVKQMVAPNETFERDVAVTDKFTLASAETMEPLQQPFRTSTNDVFMTSTLPFCGLSSGSSSRSRVFTIPRPSKEILIEGMTSSLSEGEKKKQKIARYLEKRKRRLLRNKNPEDVGGMASSTRREIANKRSRVNGRFVSISEFGSAPKRRR